jgi:predicted small secreted protein
VKFRTLSALLSLLLVAFLASGCKSNTTAQSTGSGPGSTAAVTAPGSATASAGAAPAGCPSSNTTSFAKTRFVLHAGLAFGAFHRYLYKPLKAGSFQAGATGRIKTFIKAGLAALFIKREVRLAYDDTTANPTLCKAIASPLQDIGNKISDAVSALKGGDSSQLTSLEQSVQGVESNAASTGNTIQESADAPLS